MGLCYESFALTILTCVYHITGNSGYNFCPGGDRPLMSTVSSSDFTVEAYTSNQQVLIDPVYSSILYGTSGSLPLPKSLSHLSLTPATATFRFRSMKFRVKGISHFTVTLRRSGGKQDITVTGTPSDTSQWQSTQISLKGISEIKGVKSVQFEWGTSQEAEMSVDEILILGCTAQASSFFTTTATVPVVDIDTDDGLTTGLTSEVIETSDRTTQPTGSHKAGRPFDSFSGLTTNDAQPTNAHETGSGRSVSIGISLTSVLTSSLHTQPQDSPDSPTDASSTSGTASPTDISPTQESSTEEMLHPPERHCETTECSQGQWNDITEAFVFTDLPPTVDFLALRSLLIVHTSVTVTAGSTFRAYRRLDVSLYTIRLSVRTKGCHLVTAKLKDANGEQTFTEVPTVQDEYGEAFCLTLHSDEVSGGIEAFSLTFGVSGSAVTIDSVNMSGCSAENRACPVGYRHTVFSDDFLVARSRETLSGNSASEVFQGRPITMKRRMLFKLMTRGSEHNSTLVRRVRIFTDDWTDFKLKYRDNVDKKVITLESRIVEEGIVEIDIPPGGVRFKSWFVLAMQGPVTVEIFTVKWIEVDACIWES